MEKRADGELNVSSAIVLRFMMNLRLEFSDFWDLGFNDEAMIT